MKKFLTSMLAMLLLVTANLFSQNFYYGPEGRVTLEVSTSKILVQFQDGVPFEQQLLILAGETQIVPLQPEMMLPAPNITLLDLQNVAGDQQVYDLLDRLEDHPQIVHAGHFLEHADGTLHGVTNQLLVRLKNAFDKRALEGLVNDYGAAIESVNEFDPLLYHVAVQPGARGNALELANELAISNVFEYAEPDFLRLMKRFNTNDPFVNNQWSLENTGSNTSQWGGIAGIDMSVFDAWSITTGSAGIKIAIIDEGVDLNHPDLVGNMLGGYDATGQGSGGNMQGNDAHGTACAGIVAATANNNIGVAGVAYSAKIIPIRIAYSNAQGGWVTSNTWIANGMNWAWQTGGADILSNSWGGGGVSSAINGAISGAVNNGRGGLGSPVLFSAGNGNGAVSYPANNNETIAVIAMSMCGERKNPSSCDGETWWGSDYGTNGDVAAPGVKIYTTDISGSSGYSGGDYTSSFNGTSSACPNAAGVMALILSANNTLTESQARAILEGNCDKVGGYTYNSNVPGQPNGTWSNDLGYGLVNAHAAVLAVAPASNDDAGISSIVTPAGSVCATTVSPQVVLNNYGANTLSSVTINYDVDGGSNNTYNWTGSLASASSTTVTLPSVSFSGGSHTFNASTSNPNGNSDTNPSNDDANSSFYAGSNGLTLTIVLDNYPGETTWDLRDGGGNVVASGGPYSGAGSTVVENMCVPDGCYDFTIYDSYGDGICCAYGSGSYTLTEDASGNTLASGGAFTFSETTNICVSSGPTCTDGIQNGNETGVDCGGPDCPACPTCTDGIQNGNETGVDCGGPDCPACPTCNDGIQNGQETGVDCGGPDCPACPTCTDGIQNGQETGVDCGGPDCPECDSCNDGIQNGQETGVDCGGPDCPACPTCNDGIQNGQETGVDCGGPDCPACPTCTDGIQNGQETGVDCGGPDCPACPTCNDGIQNGQETGVDCGGPDCPPCGGGGCTYVTIDFEDFEGGWGIWNDGGSDCRRSANDASYAFSGTYCARLRDNTSTSVMTTDNLDLSNYDEITVDFTYYPRSMDNASEDFWLQISTNGGGSYTTVEEWNRGDEFQNDVREFDTVVIPGPFTSSTRLRFRCDASGNSDWIYIDDVDITGCSNGPNGQTIMPPAPKEEPITPEVTEMIDLETAQVQWKIFPNPTRDLLNVSVQLPDVGAAQLFITDYTGKMIQTIQLGEGQEHYQTAIETHRLNPGVYFLHLVGADMKSTKKFVVVR
jgi:subtilisin family serine protease